MIAAPALLCLVLGQATLDDVNNSVIANGSLLYDIAADSADSTLLLQGIIDASNAAAFQRALEHAATLDAISNHTTAIVEPLNLSVERLEWLGSDLAALRSDFYTTLNHIDGPTVTSISDVLWNGLYDSEDDAILPQLLELAELHDEDFQDHLDYMAELVASVQSIETEAAEINSELSVHTVWLEAINESVLSLDLGGSGSGSGPAGTAEDPITITLPEDAYSTDSDGDGFDDYSPEEVDELADVVEEDSSQDADDIELQFALWAEYSAGISPSLAQNELSRAIVVALPGGGTTQFYLGTGLDAALDKFGPEVGEFMTWRDRVRLFLMVGVSFVFFGAVIKLFRGF